MIHHPLRHLNHATISYHYEKQEILRGKRGSDVMTTFTQGRLYATKANLQELLPIGATTRRWSSGRAAAVRGHGRLRPAHRGSRLQGTHKELPPAASPSATRGRSADYKGGGPLAGRLLAGKDNCRLYRGCGGGILRVKEG
ncbi:hypothetical protein BHM03_00039270 [Ensete ventricosum]|uniref:Uncharacterized protein n=1 Tax=Ensete ventricosum TaxID=4639 RepID=A0A445MK04_ENSVE|nr:hypothetical protein BHM03_00039270 [Ensete ventricosum]